MNERRDRIQEVVRNVLWELSGTLEHNQLSNPAVLISIKNGRVVLYSIEYIVHLVTQGLLNEPSILIAEALDKMERRSQWK